MKLVFLLLFFIYVIGLNGLNVKELLEEEERVKGTFDEQMDVLLEGKEFDDVFKLDPTKSCDLPRLANKAMDGLSMVILQYAKLEPPSVEKIKIVAIKMVTSGIPLKDEHTRAIVIAILACEGLYSLRELALDLIAHYENDQERIPVDVAYFIQNRILKNKR